MVESSNVSLIKSTGSVDMFSTVRRIVDLWMVSGRHEMHDLSDVRFSVVKHYRTMR